MNGKRPCPFSQPFLERPQEPLRARLDRLLRSARPFILDAIGMVGLAAFGALLLIGAGILAPDIPLGGAQ